MTEANLRLAELIIRMAEPNLGIADAILIIAEPNIGIALVGVGFSLQFRILILI